MFITHYFKNFSKFIKVEEIKPYLTSIIHSNSIVYFIEMDKSLSLILANYMK
jgi:hypothetical protein